MKISLTKDQIERTVASRGLREGLAKYAAIQNHLLTPSPIATDAAFRKRFNGFYRVRRNGSWQAIFYRLMDRARRQPMAFSTILLALHGETGRCEASFASKLHATVNPDWPVIDSVVLGNVGVRLPWPAASDRIARIEGIYNDLAVCYRQYLASQDGVLLVTEFRKAHPAHQITTTKMLDMVLWQTR